MSEKTRSSERTLARECAWCGGVIKVKPRAQHQRYCGRSCRQRAYEVRTAVARQETARATGAARPPEEPVREVVERVVVRTVRPRRVEPWPVTPQRVEERLVEVPVVASPRSAWEAADFMTATAALIADGTIGVHDHKRVYQGVRNLLHAFDQTHPGGLERLMGGRR